MIPGATSDAEMEVGLPLLGEPVDEAGQGLVEGASAFGGVRLSFGVDDGEGFDDRTRDEGKGAGL